MKIRNLSKPVLILLVCFLCSFVGGCTTKITYDFFNGPEWLNSVVVGIFVGLGACFGSLMAITASMEKWNSKSDFAKPKALLALILCIPMLLLGLLALWETLLNFSAIISIK